MAALALNQFMRAEVRRDSVRYTNITMDKASMARPVWLSVVLAIETSSG